MEILAKLSEKYKKYDFLRKKNFIFLQINEKVSFARTFYGDF